MRTLETLDRVCELAQDFDQDFENDKQNLIVWAEALLEIAEYQDGNYSKRVIIKGAIFRLQKAVSWNTHGYYGYWLTADAYWLMGDAYIAYALTFSKLHLAQEHFDKASGCFDKAVALMVESRWMRDRPPALQNGDSTSMSFRLWTRLWHSRASWVPPVFAGVLLYGLQFAKNRL